MSETVLDKDLKNVYDNYYNDPNREWRELGARDKAGNIIELSKSIKFNNVLEVGAGDGSILMWLDKWGFCENMSALEISESGAKHIESRNLKSLKEVKIFDGYHIPYKDKQFDLVICSHVIEHVEHPRMLLREIKRISKFQIFEIPIDFSFSVDKKTDFFLSYGHINIYHPALFRFLLLSEGFRILKDKNSLYSKDIQKIIYKNNFVGYFKILILRALPFLLKFKTNAFTVLSDSSGKDFKIG